MSRFFSEPKSSTIVFATFLAAFELLNILGEIDTLVTLINEQNVLPEFATVDGKEKLVFISFTPAIFANLPYSLWGDLEITLHQDGLISVFLLSVLLRIWINRPSKIKNYRKRPKIITIKSKKWFFLSVFSIAAAAIFIINKLGKFADMYEKLFPGTFAEGALLNPPWKSPRWIEPLPELVFVDYLQIIILCALVLFCLNKCFKITLPKKLTSDNLTTIEKVWKNTDDAISIGLSNPNKSLPLINKAFGDLVDLLSVSATMNIAATALEDGDVKSSFDKWGRLTSAKGRESEKWQGLSNSLSDIGHFGENNEEE